MKKPAWTLTAGALLASGLFAGCASSAPQSGGGYYLDDGPGRPDPQRVAQLMSQPDPIPKDEPLRARANRPYEVMGQKYVPMTERRPYRQQGVASWYGQRFHGKATSIGEPYDMYSMTAAHPTLPLPSYVRVTRLDTGRSVIVRVNDRGPFLRGRLIDLSYLAATKLGYVGQGHAKVEVELIDPRNPEAVRLAQAAAATGGMDSALPAPDAMAAPAASSASAAAATQTPSSPARTQGSSRGAPIHEAMQRSERSPSSAGAVPIPAAGAGMAASPVQVTTSSVPAGSLAKTALILPAQQARAGASQMASDDATAGDASQQGRTMQDTASQDMASQGVTSQGADSPVGAAPDEATKVAASGVAPEPAGMTAGASSQATPDPLDTSEAPPVSQELRAYRKPDAPRAGKGWFLQLGAFKQLDNALRAQREQQARTTPADPPLELEQQGNHYRVLLGPYASEGEARAAAAEIGTRIGHKPGVMRR